MAEMALLLEELQAHPQDLFCFVEEAILPTKLPFRISGDGRLDPRPDWHLNIGFLFNAAGTVMCPPLVMFRLEDELAQGIENPAEPMATPDYDRCDTPLENGGSRSPPISIGDDEGEYPLTLKDDAADEEMQEPELG
ncbi:unnamed protein product [Closterium sp. Naga37s-1]|nr:unnamed protein product [Closterium sp. Naga37s-1]